MRVLHVVESFAGGVLDFLEDITSEMPDYEHIIFHGIRPETPPDFMNRFGSNTIFIRWRYAQREINLIKDIPAIYFLFRFMKKEFFDVIHLHSSKAGFSGRLVARLLGLERKVIYTPHGVSFLRKDVSNLTRSIYVFLEKIGASLGGRIIACSRCEAEEMNRHAIKADFIFNGVRCLKGGGLMKDDTYVTIVTMARITEAKNPELFAMIARYFKDKKNVRFIWIGDGDKGLRELLESNGVYVTGWLKRSDANNLLSIGDIYLSTSLWEGISISVINAMCLSLPLVLSSWACHRDCVFDSENGYLFDSLEGALNCIELLIDNRELRIKMGERSFSYYKKFFTLKNMVDSYNKAYLGLS